MDRKHLLTFKWTQPYATTYQRPYVRGLQEEMEQVIERLLEHSDFTEANNLIKRIQHAGKS